MTVVDDIKNRLDLLEVVSGYASLQRSGRAYKANCPFHQERTPSFYVNPESQTWRCFGACATGGDVFTFIMRAENLEFSETLQRLAQQAGVALPSRERRTEQDVAYRVNEAARDYFQQYLSSSLGADARAYLERRGISKESVAQFQLGLSPRDGKGLFTYLQRRDFSPEELTQAGVAHRNQDGGGRDVFRGRLMIPIRNGQGDLGGFGSRALDDSIPKYLNTARTSVFDKGRLLYGLYLAKESARRQGVVIVEGYMDVIMAHQHGFDNVVASMGTALTEHQVAEARRLTNRITMALDADAAGQQATLRSLESSWQVFQSRVAGRSGGATLLQRQDNLELKVIALPEGKDPDEFIRQSPERWPELVSRGAPLFEYLLPALSSHMDLTIPQGKARMVELLFPFIAAVQEPIQQDHYNQVLAAHLGISEDTLQASFKQYAARARRAIRPGSSQQAATRPSSAEGADSAAFAALNLDPLEDYCLALLLKYPDLPSEAPEVADLSLDYFRRPENREIYSRLVRAWAEAPGVSVSGAAMTETLKGGVPEELAEHLVSLAQKKIPPLEPRSRVGALRDAVTRLEERYLKELKRVEQARFADALPEVPDRLPGQPPDPSPDYSPDPSEEEALALNCRIKANQQARNQSTQNAFRGR